MSFDSTQFVIERYENELPDMLLGAHEDYNNGNIDAKAYEDALRKIYAVLEMLYIGGNK